MFDSATGYLVGNVVFEPCYTNCGPYSEGGVRINGNLFNWLLGFRH
jgi:hypothetical protein